jgi:hypothetical protein
LPKKRKKAPKRKARKAKRRKTRKAKTSIYTKLGKAVWKALSSKNYLKLLSI